MGTATGNMPVLTTLRARLPAEGTAGTGGEYVVGHVKVASAVVAARYIPDSAVTGVATNNKTLSVVNKGTAGTGTQNTCALTFASGTNASATRAASLTLDTTVANRDVPAGAAVTLKSLVNGTGMVLPSASIEVDVVSD